MRKILSPLALSLSNGCGVRGYAISTLEVYKNYYIPAPVRPLRQAQDERLMPLVLSIVEESGRAGNGYLLFDNVYVIVCND